MKKTISALAAVVIMLAAVQITAFAHGHARSAAAAVRYGICGFESCNVAGTHSHNGNYYYGHYIGDGHDYHQVCSVKGCAETVNHQHDGITCSPHNYNDGHSYHTSRQGGGYHH